MCTDIQYPQLVGTLLRTERDHSKYTNKKTPFNSVPLFSNFLPSLTSLFISLLVRTERDHSKY
jgi:hypothetical protein